MNLWCYGWFMCHRHATLPIASFLQAASSAINSPLTCLPREQGSLGQHGGPTEPRWAPCWPHELCYLGRDPDQVPTTDVAGDCWLCYTEPCMVKRATQDSIIIRPCSWKITWDYTGKFYDNRVNDELLDVFVSLKSDLLHLFRLMQYKVI